MRSAARADVFDRWTPVWHGFFYVMIATATALVVTSGDLPDGRALHVGAIVAVLTVWHAVLMVRPGHGHRERPAQVGAYLAGATALSGVLVAIHPVFLMVAMSLYNQVFAFLVMRWALPAAIAVTATIAVVAMRTADSAAIVTIVVGAATALLFSVYLTASADESRKRRELIEELERTREQLALAERLAGKTDERRRLARELHDTVTQQLVGVVMHLEAATDSHPSGAVDTREALTASLRLAREGLAEARRLVWADRPAQLEAGSLTRALGTVTERVAKETGLAIEPSLGNELDALPAAVQTLVLRAVQETLANVRKHARARRVALTASVSEDLLTLDVQDDGAGFDPATTSRAASGAGFGLRGLRERVEALGGQLAIESTPGVGTTVALHVPLREESA